MSSASIASCESAAVGAGELDRLAERLEDRDRLASAVAARRVAVAGEPVEPRDRTRAAPDGLLVAELRRRSADRALDRRERVVEPADATYAAFRELLEHDRLLGSR